jgi:fructose 1,6-bisphosphate aldolase/phosphatase
MLTISAIKADVGSIGGHTRPSEKMLEVVADELAKAAEKELIIDYDVTHTGDDICLLMVHRQGDDSTEIHGLAWETFKAATAVAQDQGLYGAGQDLLVDAPSGNVRGAGPGVAEITYDPEAQERPAEPFLVFTADKCSPGAFNFPLMSVFTNPMYCAGLLLPAMKVGFRFVVIDMDHVGMDRVISLDAPDELYDLAVLLRDEHRFGIDGIYSRRYPEQRVAAVSAHRLHTIAGTYTGKDDPVALVRTQGIFPAPEEVVSPYVTAHFVAGDARGSHHMPLMPVAINTAVAGAYCLPLVACVAYSVTKEGKLSEREDVFGNPVWDATRLKAQRKGEEMRQQGFFGAAMLPISELEYGAIRKVLADLEERFEERAESG